MTLSILHSFVSAKSQGTDPTKASKNEWNAEHTITAAALTLLGAISAGPVVDLNHLQVKGILGFPTTTVDNTIPRFDGVLGNLQSSGLSIDDSNNLILANPLSVIYGGTGFASYIIGDLLQASSTTALAKLAAGTTGYHLQANGAGVAVSWQGFLQSGTGAVTRTWLAKAQEGPTPEDFGADPTGSADSLTALQNLLAAHDVIYLSKAATYKISGTLALSRQGQSIIGPGAKQVIITSTSQSLPMITLASGVANYRLEGFTLTRSVTATSGGHGISFLGSTDNSYLGHLWVEKQWDGVKLGTCDYGWFEHSVVSACQNDGITETNSVSYGPSQWQFLEILTKINGRDGINVTSTAGPAGLILGDWTNIRTFANARYGISFTGNATTGIYDIRISGAFLGSDNSGCMYINTYGTNHRIGNAFIERAGMDATGPTLGTAASLTANGVNCTANNSDVQFNASQIFANSYSAIYSEATKLVVNGSRIYDNGASVGAERRGIVIAAGKAIITGNDIGNTGAGTSQTIGVATAVDAVTIVGNIFDGNSSAPITTGVSLVNSVIWGNKGAEAFDSVPNSVGLGLRDSDSSHILSIKTASNLTAARDLIFNPGDASRTITLSGNPTLADWFDQSVKAGASPTFITINVTSLELGAGQTDTTLTRVSAGRAAIEGSNLVMFSDAGNLPATATNDSASAGNLGQYIESVIGSGSAVSLTSTTPANLTSISLTAGDWDVDVVFVFTGNTTTTVTYLAGSISTTSATFDNTNGRRCADIYQGAAVFNSVPSSLATLNIPPLRLSLSGTTTVYAVAQALFAISTCTVFGILRARRVR